MSTRVVHVNDKIEGAVYIGRANGRRGLKKSPFANPYKLFSGSDCDRRTIIALYRKRILDPSMNLLASLPELRGKPLACWCRHDGEPRTDQNACHGDILVELLERYSDDELRAMSKHVEAV